MRERASRLLSSETRVREGDAGSRYVRAAVGLSLSVFTHTRGTHIWSPPSSSETYTPNTRTHSHAHSHTHTLTRASIACKVCSYRMSLRLPRGCTRRDRCLHTRVLQWELPASCWGWDPYENIVLFGELCKEPIYFPVPRNTAPTP